MAAIAELVPDPRHKRYEIVISVRGVRPTKQPRRRALCAARPGWQKPYLIHQVDGVNYRTKISTLRGDYQKPDGTIGNSFGSGKS